MTCLYHLQFSIIFCLQTTLQVYPSMDELFFVVSKGLEQLQNWFTCKRLVINANKTNLIVFMTRQKQNSVPLNDNHHLLLNNSVINPANSVKFLGLQLDNNLSFKNHFAYISIKICKGLYALKRASKILELKDLKTLYFALIYPYLTYGLLVWGGACKVHSYYRILNAGTIKNPMKSLLCIHKLQKRALRIISKEGFQSHHIPICNNIQLLDLEDIYNLKALSFLYDYHHGKLPPFFKNKLEFSNNRINELVLKTRYRRTDIASATIFNTLPSIWNPLPNKIKLCITKSKKIFLKEVKIHLLLQYEGWECKEADCFACKQARQSYIP